MPGGGAGAGGLGKNTPASLGARAVLWVVVSLLFLVVDSLKLARFRAAGLHASWFLWAQLAVWAVVLVFWGYTGVQTLRRGRVS